eukprot:COSAG02_NODE_46_length_45443_cov_36.731497_19_plen_384_part_00
MAFHLMPAAVTALLLSTVAAGGGARSTKSPARCDAGFAGENCATLDLAHGGAFRSIPGLLPGVHVGNTTVNTVWGGHAAEDPAGRWHWYGAAILDGKSLAHWTDASAAGHAVGNSSVGPFVFTDIALRPQGDSSWDGGSIHGVYLLQNPVPWSNKTDSWLLFYTGMPKVNPLGNRKIGVAYAPSLSGPWSKWGPVLSANPNDAAVDSSSVSNAAPAFARDGSGRILLAYKGLGKAQPSKPVCTDGSGKACISIAEAAHWTGPYHHTTADAGMKLEGEDPTLWQSSSGLWHMVYEHYTQDRSRSGAHAWSKDGLSAWSVSDNSTWVTTKTSIDGGKSIALQKRERYQVTFDSDGHPSSLWNGAMLDGHCFNIVQRFARPAARDS